jgi:hypothetical protein
MRLVSSSGHGLYVGGAQGPEPWGLDEVYEARRVVDRVAEIIKGSGNHSVRVFHDNTSRDQDTNLKTIVNYHNSQDRDLDVSVHFNSNGNTEGGRGTECWYYSQAHLAGEIAHAVSIAGELTNRGGKKSTSLYFLVHCQEPAVLVEVCFVNARQDCENFKARFEAICQALAGALVGEESLPVPPPEGPSTETGHPVLRQGDSGSWVTYLQQELNSDNRAGLATDGDFGPATDSAVRTYQTSRKLSVDGIVGTQTWEALETDAPPVPPPGLPPPMSDDDIEAICEIAETSSIAEYSWRDRGVAPVGYIKGVAVAFANAYQQFLVDYPPAFEMAHRSTGNTDKDALAWYADVFANRGLDISQDGSDTLRALWTLLMGLGMRESSGKHCEGRDQSASNTTSDTAEAGAWQTSYDARGGSDHFNTLFDAYNAGSGRNPQGFVEVFREGVSCSSSSWQNYGSGDGYKHQQMSKEQPAYAAEVCAITLRNLRQHYGPINRKEAEVVNAAEDMLKQVQDYIDAGEIVT